MKQNYKISLFSICSVFFLTNCAPKLSEKQREPVVIPNGEKFQDVNILSFADADFATKNLVKRDNTQDSLKQIEMLFEISKMNPASDWNAKALTAQQDLEKKLLTKKLSYSRSTYLDLVYDQIKAEVNSGVKDADKQIAADTKKVVDLIRKSQKTALPITLESSLHEKLAAAQKYLTFLTEEVKKMNILQEFKDSFLLELKRQSQTTLSDAIHFDEDLVRSEKLTTSLKLITDFLEKSASQISSEDQNNLNLGLQLSDSLNSMTDPEGGLQALAIVWTLLNDQQRLEYFKQANQDLYDFLSDKSPEDIQCMREKNCKGFGTTLILNFGVYPAIEKFGLKNIVDLINQKSHLFIIQKVNQVAYGTLSQIGETIAEQVLNSVSDKRNDLSQFKDNLRGHLSQGLEQAFANLKVKSPSVLLIDKQNLILDFDTQAVYIRNKINSLSGLSEKRKRLQTQFEIVESFLNLPLYSQSPKANEKTLSSDLVKLLLNPEAKQFLSSRSNSKGEVNLKQQSELLETAALTLEQFADWKTSSLDGELSAIKASDILTQFKSKDLNRSFFSKDDLTALTLSVSSQVLRYMQSDESMLVLVDNENNILPVQKVSDTSIGPIALAAATDFKNGVRIPAVNASDLSQFLNSLLHFYSATAGIENTTSKFLTEKDTNGRSILEEIIASRKNIKRLIVGVANFISNQLIQPNGLVSRSIALNENLKPLEKYDLLDQTKCIEALTKTYELTKIDVYLWTAKNIYFSMNRLLYSDKIKFYQLSTSNEVQTGVDRTKLFETYKNLILLKAYLDDKQRTQLEQIFYAWLK